jgi:hypothetical protein
VSRPGKPGDGIVDQAIAVVAQAAVVIFVVTELRQRHGSARGVAVAFIRLWLRP